MPPKLPRVSGEEAIRSLERLGFVQIRQRGSHVSLKKKLRREMQAVSYHCIVN